MLFTSGLYGDRALYAAIFGAIRLAGLIAYNIGYCTGDPKKRMMVRITFALITLLRGTGNHNKLRLRLPMRNLDKRRMAPLHA